MTVKEALNKIEGKLFYCDYYKEYLIVIGGKVYSAELTEFIKEPSKYQLDIIIKDLDAMLKAEETISVIEKELSNLNI